MNLFFRWASLITGAAVLLLAVAYFAWIRPLHTLEALPAVAASMREESLESRALTSGTPPIAATDRQSNQDAVSALLATPSPRPAVVILPPATSNPGLQNRDASETGTPEPISAISESVISESAIFESAMTESSLSPQTDNPSQNNLTALEEVAITAQLAGDAGSSPAAQISLPDSASTMLASTVITSTVLTPAVVSTPDLAEQVTTSTVSDNITWLQPSTLQTPGSLAFGIPTPTARAILVAPPIITTIPVEPAGSTASTESPSAPSGPHTAMSVPLHTAPDVDSPIAGETRPRQLLDIVARTTTGQWLLLVDGLWIQAELVTNTPVLLPLVAPTVTPTPTNTGFPTPTEEPVPTEPGPPTPTPTPTSLAFPVCDCTASTYACVTHYFPVRAQAQACFEYCFRETGRDVHNLDPDGNGAACQNLPD